MFRYLCVLIMNLGSSGRTLEILRNALKPGTRYRVTLTMVDNEGVTFGPAWYEFTTNYPPRNGRCRIIPYEPVAIDTDVFLFPRAGGVELINTTADNST